MFCYYVQPVSCVFHWYLLSCKRIVLYWNSISIVFIFALMSLAFVFRPLFIVTYVFLFDFNHLRNLVIYSMEL